MGIAVGFDLGETLLTYADTPLSWAPLYRPALTGFAGACNQSPDAAAVARAESILSEYNTRLHPRVAETTAENIFREILNAWHVEDDGHLADAISAFFGFFQQRLISYPESAATLCALRTAAFRVGVLTDVPYGMPRSFVERDLREGGIRSALDVVLTSVEVGWRKPAPMGFHALATALGVPTTGLWFVGNEEKDIAGARAAGATAVLIDRENRQPRWGQAHTLRDLRELLPLLDSAKFIRM